MKAESCKACPHRSGEFCRHHGKLLARIRGCSLSAGGRTFFRAKCGKEAFRMRVLGKKGKEGE